MKKILLIIIICSNPSFGQEYFEGIISFDTRITTTEFARENMQETLEYNYGDSLKMFYNQNGNFIRKYLNTGEYGNNYQIYSDNSGELLITYKGSEKIDTLDVRNNSLKLIDKKVLTNKEIINELNCDCIIYNTVNDDEGNVIIEFCFNPNFQKVNSKSFQNHQDFFISDFFNSSESPYLKFRMRTKEFELTFTATDIEKKKLTTEDITTN